MKYGEAKANTEISLEDMKAHPIWLWCLTLGLPEEDDGPMGGDETWMRPLISSPDITPDMVQPMILLRVKGTDLYAEGLYDHDKGALDAIGIFVGNEPVQPAFAPGLDSPVTYVSVPTIAGVASVEFQSDSTTSDSAQRVA